MENLFNYAKKELSQDAFLMWIAANWNCKEDGLKIISRDFLQFLAAIPLDEKIEQIHVMAQWNRIDVRIDVVAESGKTVIFIEDKTTSDEHNQLIRYNQAICKYIEPGVKVKKLFYKTHLMESTEESRVKEAGWDIIEFGCIKDFWNKYTGDTNLVVSQYASHIIKIWEDCHNTVKPNDNNIDAWKSYFASIIAPKLKNCSVEVNDTRFGYAYLKVRPTKQSSENMPYLEIRGRDCSDNRFRALILMYDVDYSNHPNGLQEIRDCIKSREKAGVFIGNYGKKKNKQVAHTEVKQNVCGDEDFVKECQSAVDEYIKIVEFWK